MILCGSYVFLTKSDFYGIFFIIILLLLLFPMILRCFLTFPHICSSPARASTPSAAARGAVDIDAEHPMVSFGKSGSNDGSNTLYLC
jgi:uncharacterized SAM-binding protein YcdF (DUF218 family)